MFEKLKAKKAIRQNYKLLKSLKCKYCSNDPKVCDRHCLLLAEQIKDRERELDEM